MEITGWELLGGAGFACIEASYLTQTIRLWKRKEADDISILFPTLNLSGRLMGIAYSLHLGQSVFFLGFLCGALLRLTFMVQVLYYQYAARVARNLATTQDAPHPEVKTCL